MSLEKIIELIFGTIILGVVGFIGVQLFDMKGTLSSVSAKVESTDSRVSRIAETLPEVKARVAWEEVNEPLKGFVLKIKNDAENNKSGQTETIWKTYNAESEILKTYKIALSDRHKEHVINVIAGKI